MGVVIASAVLLTSCNLDDDNVQPVPVSYVSIYNAIPDAPELDVTVDSRLIMPRAFEFGDNTYYMNFYVGQRNFQITPFGANNVVVDTTFTLADDNAYSLFMVGDYDNAELLVTNDSAAMSEEGVGKIRLINLSPDASPVSLRIRDGEGILIDEQAFKNASAFVEVSPDTYDFEILSATGELPLRIDDVELKSGIVRTIVVRGYRNPPSGNTNALSAEVIRN